MFVAVGAPNDGSFFGPRIRDGETPGVRPNVIAAAQPDCDSASGGRAGKLGGAYGIASFF
jgi:hypothetical protein